MKLILLKNTETKIYYENQQAMAKEERVNESIIKPEIQPLLTLYLLRKHFDFHSIIIPENKIVRMEYSIFFHNYETCKIFRNSLRIT